MNESRSYKNFKNLSLRRIKSEVKKIKKDFPIESQSLITYSKNFTLSLSNYCQNFCGYCFYNSKIPKLTGPGNVIILGNEEMISLVQKGLQFNCKEALLMSGEKPDSFQIVKDELEKVNCKDFLDFVKDVCNYLLDFKLLTHTNIGFLTFDQIKELKNYSASMGLMLESTSKKLFKKGGVHELSPGKTPKNRIEHIRNAGKLKIPFTTGLLLGIGESFEDRVKDLKLIRKIHEEFGHIQEVIIQNYVKKENILYQPQKLMPIEEMLKVVGIAKLIFGNEISIQVPPNLIIGYEEDFIDVGINDFGGISPFALDYINPEKEWPQIDYLKRICKGKGYKLKERLPIYDKFINKNGFCPDNIKKIIDYISIYDHDADI